MADGDIIASLLQDNEELQAQLHDENEITNILSKRVEILEQDNHIFARIITTHIKQVQYILSQPTDNTEKLKKISVLIEQLIPRDEVSHNESDNNQESDHIQESDHNQETIHNQVEPQIKIKKPRKKKDN
jgi:hypothetical protein